MRGKRKKSFDRVGEDRGWRRDPLYRGHGEGVLVHGEKERSVFFSI
jgi:hypothetical protein